MKSASLAVIALLFQCVATAHPLDIAYLQIKTEGGSLQATLDVHPNVAASLIGTLPEELNPEKIASFAARFLDGSFRDSHLISDRGDCVWGTARAESFAQTIRLVAAISCPAEWRQLDWKLTFLNKLSRTYQVLGRSQLGAEEQVFTAQWDNNRVHLTGQSTASIGRFVHLGIEHIGVLPSQWRTPAGGWKLPYGIDHILFLLALILGGGTLMQMLATVTGFTLGHSLTLALGLLGWVHLSPRLVEPLIALTITYAAAESLYLVHQPKARWRTAAGFGLVHGLSFASVLGQLHLDSLSNFLRTLFGFNFGIEIGQALIVAVLAPIVLCLRRSRFFLNYGLGVCSLGISGTGLYWFWVRAFG